MAISIIYMIDLLVYPIYYAKSSGGLFRKMGTDRSLQFAAITETRTSPISARLPIVRKVFLETWLWDMFSDRFVTIQTCKR